MPSPEARQRSSRTIVSPFGSALLFAVMGLLVAPLAEARDVSQPLVAIINPQGNFLSSGVGTLLHKGPSFGGQLVWNWEFAGALAMAKTRSGARVDVDIITQQVTQGAWPAEMGEAVSVVQKRSSERGRIRIVRLPLSQDGAYLDKEASYPELPVFAARVQNFYLDEGRWPSLAYAAYADGAVVAETRTSQ